MTCYQFSARLLSPLMVQKNRQSNTSAGLPYLPGTTFRGALAGACLRYGINPDGAGFQDVFLENPVFFPDLLPAQGPGQSAFPLPATACSCKRFPGFKLLNEAHGAGDTLASMAAARQLGHPLKKANICHCQQDMKPFTGFWNGNPDEPNKTDSTLVYQRHTGIDRHTGTVAPSIFYVTQGIAECRKGKDGKYYDQYLTGATYLSESQYEFILKQLEQSLFAGADRTRGMGELKITLKQIEEETLNISVWSKKFRAKVEKLSGKPLQEGLYFSVGFNSHIILVDQFLRPEAQVILDFPDIEPVLRVVNHHQVRGWQSSWQLPKPEDPALAMGGVCLFRYTGKDTDGLSAFLSRIMKDGIGLRRAEGFGRLRICDSLHIQEVI